MSGVFDSTDRLELSGDGHFIEGERLRGRVSYRIVARKKPNGLGAVQGSASALPGSEVNFLDLLLRRAPLTLVFSGGTWECYVTNYDPLSGAARLANRSGTKGVQLDQEPGR